MMKLKTVALFCISIALIQFAPSTALATNKLRVITYNTWGLPRPFLIGAGRFKKIAATIPKFFADIIGFQETFTKYADVLQKVPGYPYKAFGSGKIKGKKILTSGLLLLSKYPIVETEYMVYSKCSGFDCFAAKGVLWAKVAVPGVGEVNVFTTHTNAGSNKKVKSFQLVEAQNFIQKHLEGRSTLFLGDFNLQPGSEDYNYVHYAMDFADSLDLYLTDHPEYSQDPDVIYSYILAKHFFKRRLDYVWLKDIGSKSMHPVNYKVIFNNKNGKRLSDHLGVMVDLEFN